MLHVVQVGANDGKHNDPIYPFMRTHAESTRILLIEPQDQLLPFLRSNYEWHPDALIVQCAIGSPNDFMLFGVREDCWADCVVPYAKPDWPAYRAPTGITSASREHVASWVARYYRGTRTIDDVVVEIPCRSTPLAGVIEDTPFEEGIDLLQIDAESFDDEVIYHSNIPEVLPRMINFESASLTGHRATELSQFLGSEGYTLVPTGADTLAIRTRPPLGTAH